MDYIYIYIWRYICPVHVTDTWKCTQKFCILQVRRHIHLALTAWWRPTLNLHRPVDGFKIASGNKDKWQHLTLIQRLSLCIMTFIITLYTPARALASSESSVSSCFVSYLHSVYSLSSEAATLFYCKLYIYIKTTYLMYVYGL